MSKDYYRILGVGRKADDKEIKSAYRKLARQYHPDVNPNDPTAETKFKEVSEAYATLGDPDKRKMYDRFGSDYESMQGGFGGQRVNTGPFNVDFGRSGGQMGEDVSFDSIFEQIFNFGGVPSPPRAEAQDVERLVELSLEEIDRGSKRTLTYRVDDVCASCRGTGTVQLSGRTSQGVCPACGGKGRVSTARRIEVRIPAGIHDGKKLRVPGGGSKGGNGRTGDLYVVVRETAHPGFKRKGDDLETDVAVSFATAALGGEIEIATLRGTVKMRIPEGTQSGQVFRLANQGISRMGGGGRGNLMARVKITVPKKPTREQKKLFKQLRDLEVAV